MRGLTTYSLTLTHGGPQLTLGVASDSEPSWNVGDISNVHYALSVDATFALRHKRTLVALGARPARAR